MILTRRSFMKNAVAATLATPFACSNNIDLINEPLEIHLFSKHLHFLSIKEAAQVAAELGFDGLDLTVRPKGHVLPENALKDLPGAIQDIKAAGSTCKMMTTAIADVNSAHDMDIIKTAGHGGVQYYRSDWFKYHEDLSMEDSLSVYQDKVKDLSEANKQHGLIGCYQNHAGIKIGASYWEINTLLKKADQDYFGVQYDIRHALVEGGKSWSNGLKLLKDQIKTIVLKDFKWSQVNGKWELTNVPMGEGMVDFKAYFKLLKSYGLKPPVSLHLEYPSLGGANKGHFEITVDHKVVYDAMKKDLAAAQKLWRDA